MKKKILLSGIAAACLAFLIGAILMITGFVTEKSVKWIGPTDIHVLITSDITGQETIDLTTSLKTEVSGMYHIDEADRSQSIFDEKQSFPVEEVRNQAYDEIKNDLDDSGTIFNSYTEFTINGSTTEFDLVTINDGFDSAFEDNEKEFYEGLNAYLEENVSENQIVYPSFGMQWTEIVLGSVLMIGGIATVIALPIVSKKLNKN